MIQRKQSLYLLAISIICALLIIFDLPVFKGTVQSGDLTGTYAVTIAHMTIAASRVFEFNTYSVVYSLTANALIALIAIFLYKNRRLQLKLTGFNFLFLGLSFFLMVYSYLQLGGMEDVRIISTNPQFGLLGPPVLMVLNVLAMRGIKKDIELLASVDRLR